jgi:uncharacterized protein (DUF885 family)
MKLRASLALLGCLLLPATAGWGADSDASPTARLHALFDREWAIRLKENPQFATSVGDHEYDALLAEINPSDLERRNGIWKGLLAELNGIDRSTFSAQDRVNAAMFQTQLEERIKDYGFGSYQMPFNADSGFHSGFAMLADSMPFTNTKQYENYLSRLRAWPRYVDQQIVLMRQGIARGFTVPKAVLNGYDHTISAHVVSDVEKSVFYRPFEHFPATMSAEDRERLKAEAREVIANSAVAGYRTLLTFYLNEYLPHARTTIAARDLPDGPAYYGHQIHRYTTLDLSADEIHRQGLAEVERIGKEMDDVIRQVGFQGDRAAFIQFLRTDPRFYAKTPEELLKDAAWICKRMDGKLPQLFKTLPRLPYTVEPVPDHIAPKYTSGRYVEAPAGSTKAGTYWVNTYQLESRPLYNLEALTLHESVPGHHIQIARSQELSDLPNFRRYSYNSAFGEGWGLYAEWLGLEAGFYKDPYSNFGRLTYEMWRACRLVVDTGIHTMGWTRQQAIDYLSSHTALPLHEVETETDRYISWPAQALSYKLGELTIKRLRALAETKLGPRFDVREFHDVVLGSGAVPLHVLEDNVKSYIAEKSAAPAEPQRGTH